MSVCVVIPARGGSEGVQRKNLQPVGGIPLVTRAVITACTADVGDVIVSTDDDEIAEHAQHAGARVHFRNAELSTSTATSDDVVIDAVSAITVPPEYVILMQCTSPFTRPQDVERVADMLQRGADCVVAVTAMHSGVWTLHGEEISMQLCPFTHDTAAHRQPRHMRETLYRETGALYGMRWRLMEQHRNRFCGPAQAHFMAHHKSLEIDTLWDLNAAQRMEGWPVK